MKFGFVAKHRGIWPVRWICEALGVSRAGFYAWLDRPPSARAIRDEALSREIRASFLASDRTYGARRVWRDVLAAGLDCGRQRIERLMRSLALRARPRRRRLPVDSGIRPTALLPANTLDRNFKADRPNAKWVADFTYVWTAEGWLYVAVVLDLFSRRIVGWSMRADMTSELVTGALMMAIWRRGRPKAVLHHSDRGSQYGSEAFQRLLAENGIECSMSRAGDVWDNAAMESFFSSLKVERVDRKVYRTRDEARADVFDYIERFYNPRRRHSTLGYDSPMAFEAKTRIALLRVRRTRGSPESFAGEMYLYLVQQTLDKIDHARALLKAAERGEHVKSIELTDRIVLGWRIEHNHYARHLVEKLPTAGLRLEMVIGIQRKWIET